MTDDEIIQKIFDEIIANGRNPIATGKLKIVTDENLVLINTIISNCDIFKNSSGVYLSDKGQIVLHNFNSVYSDYLKDCNERKRLEFDKLKADLKLIDKQNKVFWLIFSIGLFGGSYSLFDAVSNIIEWSNKPHTQEIQKEIIQPPLQEQQHTLVLPPKKVDSLYDSNSEKLQSTHQIDSL